jgi:hypothetical protein
MNEITVKLVGISPILIHNNQGASPISPYAKAMKPLTSKRNKTDADYMEIARVEWESGLYLYDGVVAIPARCLERCFWEGSKKSKNGKNYKSGCMVVDDYHPLAYKGTFIKVKNGKEIPNTDLDKYYEEHSHQDMVKVGGNQVLRTRPIFHDWSLTTRLLFDENVLDERTLRGILEISGRLIGLCEQRPRLGRFEIEDG